MSRSMRIWVISLLLIYPSLAAPSQPLPLPRYVSLRAKAVNLHVGPGTDYPIIWKYTRSGLPVEIVSEFDTWREIRDWEGTQGWVHKTLLTSKRTAILKDTDNALYIKPEASSTVVANLKPGVIGQLIECKDQWCYINVDGYKGWLLRDKLWGMYPREDKFK